MSTSIARRYAQALLDIGVEQDKSDVLGEQLSALADLYSGSREFQITMLNPGIKSEERKDLMRTIASKFGLDPMMLNFTLLLLDNERFKHIESIYREYQRLADERAGHVRAEVRTATTLGPAQRDALAKQLKHLTGATTIELQTEVDPSLIGGVVAKVGGMVLDGSVHHQLEMMREAILHDRT